MSDRAIPRSFRFMEGFGVHTFRLLNSEGQSTFVKFHWMPKLGLQSVLWNEAVKINGADPDFHRRDLWNAIQTGAYPEWELCLQMFDQETADSFDFDVLDPTKIVPEEVVKPIAVGRLVLDRMPDNFFAETEQVAFMTQNVPPGIDFSDDPLLQGRNFSYLDTQLKRLGGPNFTHLPINAPKCPFAHFQQDGHMAMRNPVGRANYQPNSWGEGPREVPRSGFRSHDAEVSGVKQRARPESFADHYTQARLFLHSQTAMEQAHIANALVFELSKCEMPVIRERMVSHLRNIDEALAEDVAHRLGLEALPMAADTAIAPRNMPPSDALSIQKNPPSSFEGRKVGVLVGEGCDATLLTALLTAIEAEGAVADIIAPKIGGVTADDGTKVVATHMIAGAPSVLFDAVALLMPNEAAQHLARMTAGRDFVSDAFAHCKFIGFVGGAVPLMDAAGVRSDADGGMVALAKETIPEFIQKCRKLRLWGRERAVKP